MHHTDMILCITQTWYYVLIRLDTMYHAEIILDFGQVLDIESIQRVALFGTLQFNSFTQQCLFDYLPITQTWYIINFRKNTFWNKTLLDKNCKVSRRATIRDTFAKLSSVNVKFSASQFELRLVLLSLNSHPPHPGKYIWATSRPSTKLKFGLEAVFN